jgi:hypothetical protein
MTEDKKATCPYAIEHMIGDDKLWRLIPLRRCRLVITH